MRKFNIVVTDELVVSKPFYADTLEKAKNQADVDFNNTIIDTLAQNGYERIAEKEYEIDVEFTKEYALDEVDEAYGNFWNAIVELNEELNDWTPEGIADVFGKDGQLREKLMSLQNSLSKMQEKISDYETQKF